MDCLDSWLFQDLFRIKPWEFHIYQHLLSIPKQFNNAGMKPNIKVVLGYILKECGSYYSAEFQSLHGLHLRELNRARGTNLLSFLSEQWNFVLPGNALHFTKQSAACCVDRYNAVNVPSPSYQNADNVM